MINTKDPKERAKVSKYWLKDTKRMIEKKSNETHISENKLTELCLQRYLPSMTF